MKKILMYGLTLFLVAVLTISGTYAYFTGEITRRNAVEAKTTTIQATFRDVTNVSEINEFQLTGSSWFNVVNSNGGSNGMGYSMDYEITPKAYNPFSLEIEGQLKLTSSNSEYIVHLTQKGCQQPYGIMPFDSTEMPYCSSSNNIKRFYVDKNAQRIMFKCNYELIEGMNLISMVNIVHYDEKNDDVGFD